MYACACIVYVYEPLYRIIVYLCIYILYVYVLLQRPELVQVLGMREETSYSILPELSVSEVTTHEEDSIFFCSMESDVEDLVADSYNSSDDSENGSDDEDQSPVEEHQSLESPSPPEISYLSFVNLECSTHSVPSLSEHESPVPAPIDVQPWHGYSIYGDNIDKNVHPRHQTVSRKTRSLHMFHSFANFDRVNLAGVSDEAPSPIPIDSKLLMPSASDMQSVTSRFVVMISR